VRRGLARVAGVAHRADAFARLDALALAHLHTIEVGVVRGPTAFVPDPHHVAAQAIVPRLLHVAGGGGQHRRAAFREDVDALMLAPATVARRPEPAADLRDRLALHRERERGRRAALD